MSFKEVGEIRKSGRLGEALKLANKDLENDPENIWNKRSVAWVYFDYLKLYSKKEDFEKFIEYLDNLKALNLPDDETMVYDSCAFQIGKMVFSFAKEESIDYSKINLLFEFVKTFNFTKPSEAYSFLYSAFHKLHKNWNNYIQFADWWDFENFNSKDYMPEEVGDKKIMSLVEKAYIAYSKKVQEGDLYESEEFTINKGINKDKIKAFINKLDVIIETHPEYEYPPYIKAKLLLTLGDKSDVLKSFIPFAIKKRNNFWVWELLSDTFKSGDERKMACLCKALSLKTPNEFLVNARQKLTEILIIQGKFKEAKTEIEEILAARNDNNWKIPKQITDWTEQSWCKNNVSFNDNNVLYKQYLSCAEDILYINIPEKTVVIEFVNENKSIINFVTDKPEQGYFNYSGMIDKPKVGDIISVRFKGEGKDGFYKAITIKKSSDETVSKAVKNFQGNINMNESASFGFVENVFIEQGLIIKHKLNKNDLVKGKAIMTFNKKKDEWGWKAVEIY